jgi:hypothetical protein
VGTFEATARPLAGIGSLRERPVDVGAGFALEAAGDFTRYGPSLDVRGFPVNAAMTPSTRARVGTGVEGRVFWDPQGHVGPNGALYVTGEIVPWVDADCGVSGGRKSVLFGCYYGEAAVGARLQASYGAIADRQVWTVTLGLEFRLPLLLGILFFWPEK